MTPRASRNEVLRYEAGVLHLRLMAPPVEGAANAACCAFVANLQGVPKSDVWVTAGFKSREKTSGYWITDAGTGATEVDAGCPGD